MADPTTRDSAMPDGLAAGRPSGRGDGGTCGMIVAATAFLFAVALFWLSGAMFGRPDPDLWVGGLAAFWGLAFIAVAAKAVLAVALGLAER